MSLRLRYLNRDLSEGGMRKALQVERAGSTKALRQLHSLSAEPHGQGSRGDWK